MKTLGLVLLVAGILVLVYGGISYNRQRTILDIGSLKATATEEHHIPLSPIAGGVAVVSGLVLMVVPRRRTA
jgi:hypothetical protein